MQADSTTSRPGHEDAAWLSSQITPGARRRLLLATAAGVLAGWLAIVQVGIIAWLVHALLVAGTDAERLTTAFGVWLLTIPLRSAGLAVRDQLALKAALGIREHLRQRLMRQAIDLGPVGLAHIGTGRASAALLDQLDALEGYYARFLPQCVLAVILPLSIIAVAAFLDWLAAALLFLALPLIPLFMALVGMGADAVNRRQFVALERLSGFFLDRLQGLATLRQLGRGADTAAEMRSTTDSYRRRTMSVLRVAFLSSAVLEFFSAAAIAMVAIYVGLGLLGYLTIGPAPELTLFSGLFILLLAPDVFAPLRELAQHYHDRAAALGASRGIRELLEQPSREPPRSAGGAVMPPEPAPVAVRDLRLAYGDSKCFLSGLSFQLDARSSLILTGPSGSGKSSVLQAVMGLLAPAGGSIHIAGQTVGAFRPGGLEAGIGWLGQNPQLLPGSLRDNICLAAPDASEAAIRRAADAAGVSRFADALPDGFDTEIGERGAGISGGEAQRVALARLLLKRPPLVILDEPTARLDPESRQLVLDALRRLTGQCTLLVASHQPEQFDWIRQHLDLRDYAAS
ncbi:thiol reductant ABC exporter subunit CydD [Methylonatrum kenyense]|uniref:thiol reductant ABC exporter subunit CydD n=1 Tax=Methylonatrum kenyense TaxID=455253 RepID=UPI0020BF831F|nr:thiol reductant ABC exporter subunit CydD [Methylonatrum kenyense]MCK8515750.1 thiol reductant ABC exporter subunit CydD [Methylonatrum kenyense]